MRIKLGSDGRRFTILLPNRLMLSCICFHFLKKQARGALDGVTPSALRTLRRTVRDMRRRHPGWILVELRDVDGSYLSIKP